MNVELRRKKDLILVDGSAVTFFQFCKSSPRARKPVVLIRKPVVHHTPRNVFHGKFLVKCLRTIIQASARDLN